MAGEYNTMTGERATAIFHFFDGGIFIECEDLGKFIPAGQAKQIIDTLNEINQLTDPDTRFLITEKGEKVLNGNSKEQEP